MHSFFLSDVVENKERLETLHDDVTNGDCDGQVVVEKDKWSALGFDPAHLEFGKLGYKSANSLPDFIK